MSWDILIQDLPVQAARVADISENFVPGRIGKRHDIIAAVQTLFPIVNFSDPSWGVLTTQDYGIEFNIGDSEDCDSMMLHVRGGGEAAPAVAVLLDALKLRAIDCQTGDFFSLPAAQVGFAEWQAFRDGVIERAAAKTKSPNP